MNLGSAKLILSSIGASLLYTIVLLALAMRFLDRRGSKMRVQFCVFQSWSSAYSRL